MQPSIGWLVVQLEADPILLAQIALPIVLSTHIPFGFQTVCSPFISALQDSPPQSVHPVVKLKLVLFAKTVPFMQLVFPVVLMPQIPSATKLIPVRL